MDTLAKYRFLEEQQEVPGVTACRAFDGEHQRNVEIRIYRDPVRREDVLRERFNAECRAIADLKHPNIASLYDYGVEGQAFYMVWERPAGQNLRSLISGGLPWTVERKLGVILQVATALSHAHGSGILHRNLEPGNIRLLTDGTVKVTNFDVGGLPFPTAGLPGDRRASSPYMSPEELNDHGITTSSEVFTLGLIAYELLTGRHPFHDGDIARIQENIKRQAQFPTVEQFPDLSLSLWPLLEKCLAKEPENRFPSMADLAAACRDLLAELAEDAELMRSELQSALPRVRQAARQKGADPGLQGLQTGIEKTMLSRESQDYQTLNRLVTALAGYHALLQNPFDAACGGADFAESRPLPEAEPAAAPAGFCASPAGKLPHEEAAAVRTPAQDALENAANGFAEDRPAVTAPPSRPLLSKTPRQPFRLSRRPPGAWMSDTTNTGRPLPAAMRPPAAINPNEPPATAEAGHTPMQEAPPRQARYRAYLWVTAAVVLLALAIAVPSLMQNRPLLRTTGGTPPPAAGSVKAKSALPAEDTAGPRVPDRREILLEEARALSAAGRNPESRIFLQRLTETDPDYAPARDELERMDKERAAEKQPDPDMQQVQKLIAGASSAIRNGKLEKAGSDIDRAEQLRPGLPEVAALRKRLEAKRAEARSLAAEQAKQEEAARRQKAGETLARRTDEFYRQGNYDAALRLADEQLAQDPQLQPAQDLRARALELQRGLKAYEAAFGARRYAEALTALEAVARINPSDPNLPELRRRAEAGPETGSAVLSVYPIAERGTLMLDDQPIGAKGEVVNQTVPAGRHKLTVRGNAGVEVVSNQNFTHGQQAALVYDLARLLVRPLTEADRDRLHNNQAKDQVHTFSVEHPHGLFRGSCKGELIVGYYSVIFRPVSGSHGFNLPFKILQLRIEDRTAVVAFASDGKEVSGFRFPDAPSAQALMKLWDELKALDR